MGTFNVPLAQRIVRADETLNNTEPGAVATGCDTQLTIGIDSAPSRYVELASGRYRFPVL